MMPLTPQVAAAAAATHFADLCKSANGCARMELLLLHEFRGWFTLECGSVSESFGENLLNERSCKNLVHF
jgi:hypothetical protein